MEWEIYLLIVGYTLSIIMLTICLIFCCGMNNKVVVDEKPNDLP